MQIWKFFLKKHKPSRQFSTEKNVQRAWIARLVWGLCIFALLSPQISRAQDSVADKEFVFAQKLQEDGLFLLAARQFELFYKKYPDHEKADQALFLSGQAFFDESRFELAFEKFKELEIVFPRSSLVVEARFKLAECQAAQRNYLAAAELYKRLAIFHPGDETAPRALLLAGKAYTQASSDSLARVVYSELIRNYPDTPERLEAELAVVDLLFKKKAYQEALLQIDNLLRSLNPETKDPRIYLLLGKLHEKMGQLQQAESSYLQLLQAFPANEAAQSAHYRLGLLYQKRRLFHEALSQFDACLNVQGQTQLVAEVYLKKGDIYYSQQQFRQALESYQTVLRNSQSDLQLEARFKAAQAHQKLNENQEAEKLLGKIIAEDTQAASSADRSVRFVKRAYPELTRVKIRLNKFQEALALIRQFKTRFPVSGQLFELEYLRGEIFEKHLHDFSRAIRVYDDFLQDHPFCPLADEAQLALARSYEKMGNYALAASAYEDYLQRYPAGDDYEWVRNRTRLLSETVNFNLEEGMKEVSNVLAALTRKENGRDPEYELGRLYLDLKQFNRAVQQFKNVLRSAIDGKMRNEVFVQLGFAYYKLAEKARLEEQHEAAKAYRDSARVSLKYAQEKTLSGERSEEADFLLAKMDLAAQATPEARRARLDEYYDNWVTRYPQGRHLDFFLIRRADDLLTAHTERDTVGLTEGLALARKLLEQFPQSLYAEEAQYKEIVALHALKSDSLLQPAMDSFLHQHPDSRFLPAVLFLSARNLRQRGNFRAALEKLQEVKKRYFYAAVATRAQFEMAEIYFEMGDYQKSLEMYGEALSLWSEFHGSPDDRFSANLRFRQAQAFEKLGQDSNALAQYLEFIQRSPADERVPRAMLAIASIAKKLNNFDVSKEYYQDILRNFPNSQLHFQALVALGDIFFDKENFGEARASYLEAVTSATEPAQKRYPASQAIRCLYKQNKIKAADLEAKKFRKSFGDSGPERGQFLLDKGQSYIAQKRFVPAEKVFKKLRAGFKGTELGAQGELGLGQVYMITNHIDDALKILTTIPSKYPESTVTPLAYLNLGDFYFSNQQVENAIFAFKQVVNHAKAGENYQKALRYLIKCYDQTRLWDQAIATTRAYLEKFPRATDAFSLKIRVGEFLMKLKEYDRAIDQFQALLPYADAESEAEVQYYIGRSYREKGEFARATSEYLKVKYLTKPTKLPWHVTAQYEAGLCLKRLGKTEQAKKILKRIVQEQGKESNFGRFALQKLEEMEAAQETVAKKNGSY
ncbi:MAG: tetratricopeptide repeat protein [bacterium]